MESNLAEIQEPIVFIKRDGRHQGFDYRKIFNGIMSAMDKCEMADRKLANDLTAKVVAEITKNWPDQFQAGDVYNAVLTTLISEGYYEILGAFIEYREERDKKRNSDSKLMKTISSIMKETTRDNGNVGNGPSAKMLQIGSEASRWYTLSHIPKHLAKAHINGDIHIHDADYYEKCPNCLQIPILKLLTNGFNAGRGFIRPPKRIGSATALIAIIIQSSQNDMYGGQSIAEFDKDLAHFVPKDYRDVYNITKGNIADQSSQDVTNAGLRLTDIRKEVYQAMEGLVYNLNSMHSRAGSQIPFSSVNLGTGTSPEERLVTEQFLLAYKAGLGKGETPLFPNVIFRVKKGVNRYPGDPNYDLKRLALEVTARRMNPTYSNMDMSINAKWGDQVSYMGCRTRVQANVNGPEVAVGRGNLGFITIGLVKPAIEVIRLGSTDKNINRKRYLKKIDKLLALCEESLLHRYETVCQLKDKDITFLVSQGLYIDSEKIKPNDSIREMMKNATLSIGHIGVAEAMTVLYGAHHGQSEEVWDEAYALIEYISNKVKEMTIRHHLNFTTIATPAEGLSSRFIDMDRERFGLIPGITDKGYYTNSYHLPVDFEISTYDKFRLEGPFHKFHDAGHISYKEFREAPVNNIDAMETTMDHAFDCDAGYIGYNFPIDECPGCIHEGIINGDCPVCGESDENIRRIRRITGYLSTKSWFGPGKLSELADRVVHS